MDFYFADGGSQKGPFAVEQLLAAGLKPDLLVWREGMTDWQRADSVPETAGLFRGQAQPSVGPPPPPGYAPSSGYSAPPGYAPAPPGSMSAPVNYATPIGMTQAPPFVPGQSNRVAAGICAIFFGGFGVHKYILGMNGAATTMLLVSLLTCGFGYLVMHVISIAEGIIYLTKTDEEFHQLYVVQKKEWF